MEENKYINGIDIIILILLFIVSILTFYHSINVNNHLEKVQVLDSNISGKLNDTNKLLFDIKELLKKPITIECED